DEPCIIITGAAYHNYYHWMCDILPRLWCITSIPQLQSLPILLRAPLLPFQLETLTALGIPLHRIKWFTGQSILVKTLFFPSYSSSSTYSIQPVSWLRTHLLPAFDIPHAPALEFIYISRSMAGSRRVLNEEHVITELQTRGFQILHLENKTVKEQLEIFNRAKVVIMPHGAACVNIIFAQPGTTLIELLPSTHMSVACLALCSLNNCHYGTLLCDAIENNDMVVNIKTLLKIVDKILES
ncbi:MAG: glycosyltransferase family 61 protein, partial [Magnetococcales bacterium]|nr:glycosyltransferase family 61 protein [Magnetococcales bacterium]